MDVIAQLKALKCDPGPVHSPSECDMPQPCACEVQAAAIAEIELLRKLLGESARREGDANGHVARLQHRISQLSS